MGRRIARRDFLNGVSVAIGAAAFSPNLPWLEALGITQSPIAPEKNADYYPPTLTGMRGTTDAAMEAGHALRDGKTWANATPDPDRYDLIVVGGGISGLSAAYFYRKIAGPRARVLILENLDDFGGHAKRNEYHPTERMLLGYGGTQSIDSLSIPTRRNQTPYSSIKKPLERMFWSLVVADCHGMNSFGRRLSALKQNRI
jgi:spermidine dehydrogenase